MKPTNMMSVDGPGRLRAAPPAFRPEELGALSVRAPPYGSRRVLNLDAWRWVLALVAEGASPRCKGSTMPKTLVRHYVPPFVKLAQRSQENGLFNSKLLPRTKTEKKIKAKPLFGAQTFFPVTEPF